MLKKRFKTAKTIKTKPINMGNPTTTRQRRKKSALELAK